MRNCSHNWTRRRFVGLGTALCGTTALLPTSRAAASDNQKIAQPSNPSSQAFTQRAFEMRDAAIASGDRGYGALIVNPKSQQIVGQSPSRVITNTDPSAHAEMEAIRDAARRLGQSDLTGHVMYSSSRPCPMCEAAAYWANLNRMYFGQSATNAGAPELCRSG